MLSIKQLTKTFGDKKILDNVSLNVSRGEIAILLGASGVGKSTLLRILNNLTSYNTGSFFLDNKPLDLSTVHQSHNIGMVFQQFNLFESMTVLENITFPLEKACNIAPAKAKEIGLTLLEQYHLLELAYKPASSLSGGQKQRLAIARTIAVKPQVICLDEPTSALDPLLTTYVAQTIQNLAAQGYMVLVATHDTGLINNLTGQIYLMDSGKIVETISTAEFKKNPNQAPLIKKFVEG